MMSIDELRPRLQQHLDRLDVGRLATEVAEARGTSAEDADAVLRTYLNESHRALELVTPFLRPGVRILEVGSGLGVLSRFLHDAGYDIVELEPVGTGFDFIGSARRALDTDDQGPRHLSIGVAGLDEDEHGKFDLIYSCNVLEHLPDWQEALRAMSAVLAADGDMVHTCPNYAFPYEPHFGIPLLPLRPAATARFIPRSIAESDVWESLNWVTGRRIEAWTDQNGMTTEFRRGQIADSLDRLSTDPEFRKRHRGMAIVAGLTKRLGLNALIRRVPPTVATPMEFTIRRSARTTAH